MSSATLRLGRMLFRYRSFTPVPVLALIAFLLWRSRGAVGSYDAALLWVGVAVSLAGQVLRFYTLSWVSDGTSGQDDVLEAKQLNTRGPYAHVRNPLYVGNLLICVGLMIVAKDPLVALIGLLFFFGEYFFIIRAEEDFLRSQFGERYEQFLRDVPRWVPRLTPAYGGKLRDGTLDWRRGLKKEHNPFAAWSLGILALVAWEQLARGAAFNSLWPLAVVAFVIVVFFVVVKSWKRGWIG